MYKCSRSKGMATKGKINKEVKKLKKRKEREVFNTKPYFNLLSIETFQVIYTRYCHLNYNFKDEVPKHITNLPEYQIHLKSYQA